MFFYEPPMDVGYWQSRLDDLFPPNREVSHLRLVWEPGMEWDEVGRWVIYQMLPPGRIPLIVLPYLEGPDPRSFVRYDTAAKKVYRKRGAPLISRQQWLLYRETKHYGMPFWVVQGKHGGHKIKFTKPERLVARLKGHRTGEPPKIGDLPYASPDNRTMEKLVALDEMRQYSLMVDFAYRSPEQLDREEERGAIEAQERLWTWVESQVEGWIEELPHGSVERIAGLDRPVRIFT